MGLLVPSIVAMALIMTGQTAMMVTISVFSAIVMYTTVIITTFILRQKEPDMERPFKVKYPIVPIIALVTVLLLLGCILAYNITVLKWVLLVYAIAICYYLTYGRKHVRSIEEEFKKI